MNAVDDMHAEGFPETAFFRCDLTDEEDIRHLYDTVISWYGRVDITVNAAAIEGDFGFLDKQSTANIDEVFTTNIRGTTLSMREAIRHMKDAGVGVVINVAPLTSEVGFSLYTASKHAVLGLTTAAAIEHSGSRIRICAVSLDGNRPAAHSKDEKLHEQLARRVLFMGSDEAALMNGQTLQVRADAERRVV
ncbi:hypothetical protein A6456_09110 [Paraburkholderia tropica]|nr:hypothetical protein A6456_09110 [Paraburkholderia tropica]